MGRLRKPTKLLELKGTIEKWKPSQKNRIDHTLTMMPTDSYIEVPNFLTNPKIIEQWKNTTNCLLQWGILSEIDLIQLELAFFYLQEIKKADLVLQATNYNDNNYSIILKNHTRLVKTFNSIVSKFGLSPSDRSKLALDTLTIRKSESILDKIKNKN